MLDDNAGQVRFDQLAHLSGNVQGTGVVLTTVGRTAVVRSDHESVVHHNAPRVNHACGG